MVDRRRDRTEKLIESTFMTLLKDKQLNTITVSEIVRQCNISRGTFYLHYQDTYALYDGIIGRMTDELLTLFNTYFPKLNEANKQSLIEFVRQLVAYLATHQSAWDILIGAQHGQNIVYNIRELFIQKIMATPGVDESDPVVYTSVAFCVSGITGVLSDAFDNHVSISETQLEQLILRTLPRLHLDKHG